MNRRHSWLSLLLILAGACLPLAGNAQTTRVEDDHPSITYQGNWQTIAHPSLSGGTIKVSQEVGATASIAFNGTGIAWIAYLCPCGGYSYASIDGAPSELWDSYQDESWPQQDFFQIDGLADGPHVLTITVSNRSFGATGYTGVDAFDINPTYEAAPTVSITAPEDGALLDGVVTVTAEAYDHAGLEYVLFYIRNLETNLTNFIYDYTPPYAFTADTSVIPQGNSYRINAEAWDHTDRHTFSTNSIEVTIAHGGNTDFTQPFVEMTAPANNSLVTGSVTLSADGYDNVGITNVQFLAGDLVIGEDTTYPFSITRDTGNLPSGSTYYLRARAYDAAGNTFTSTNSVTVTVQHEDTIRPTASMTAPASGATVSGSVALAADASDNFTVTNVQFLWGSAQVGWDDTAPYTGMFDTWALRDGPATVTAKATDSYRNEGTSAPVSVNVDNRIKPGITRVDDADPALVYSGAWETYTTVSSPFQATHRFHWGSGRLSRQAGATVTFSFEGVGVRLLATECFSCGTPTIAIDGGPPQQIDLASDYLLSEGSSAAVWESPLLAPGAHTVQLTVQTNASGGSDVLIDGFEVLKVNDTAAPAVALTSPVFGDVLSGTAVFEATASDDTGVAKVLFYAGQWLLGEDTTAPYSLTWDTRNYPFSNFDVTAVAYDLVGRRTVASGGRVIVNVWNEDTATPAVTITAPAEGATVSGSEVPVIVDASWPGGIGNVTFHVRDAPTWPTGQSDTVAPYTFVWDTDYGGTLPDGTYELYATVDLADGPTFVSKPLRVIVDN